MERQTIAHYEIQSRLGAGGMGEVWKAWDPKLQRTVAIKLLRKTLGSDLRQAQVTPSSSRGGLSAPGQHGDAAGRILAEARAASALNHPHICTIYEVGEVPQSGAGHGAPASDAASRGAGGPAGEEVPQSGAGHESFIVMEHIEGRPLSELIPPEGLPPETVVRYGCQIADALSHAHAHGVVHCDLKSANVVITPDSQVKLIDFGIATPLPPTDAEAVTRTAPSLVGSTPMGTLAYMAPEVLRGEGATARSDIWALGVLLYEMASGRLPFPPGSAVELAAAILKESPEPLPTRVPPGVRAIALRALSKERAQRYASAGELHAALDVVASSGSHGELSPVPEPSTRPSIVVLPFANMSADPENEFFSDGITEDIINALSQLGGLRVVARTSSFSFKGTRPEISEIAARLNVETVLEGSVRRAGTRLRVTAQLVNAADGYQIWSERFDRELADVFEIQDEIATTIAERLRVTLEGAGEQPLVKPATRNVEAYELYAKGRSLLYKRGTAITLALPYFERSLELDPNYALACAGIADVHTVGGYNGLVPPTEAMPAGMRAARRAVELDPGLAEAHTSLGLACLFDRDWATSNREFQHALELNPNSVQARGWYGMFYLQMVAGRFDEGVEMTRRAVDIDPLGWYASCVHCMTLVLAGRTEEAVVWGRRSVEHAPDAFVNRWLLQLAYHFHGDFEEALAVSDVALALSGRHPWSLMGQAMSLAASGRLSETRGVYAELQARATREYVQPTLLAIVATEVGESEAALAAVRRAFAERDAFLVFSPRWQLSRRLREDPRVQAIFDELNLPEG